MTPVKLVALLLCAAGCSYSAVPDVASGAPAEALAECRKVCPAGTTAQITSHWDGLFYRWTCGCMDPVECRR
jgi:hypothetical protein